MSRLGKRRRVPAPAEPLLPHGWGDLLRQVAIWLGFALAYEVVRGLADRGSGEALLNAHRVIRFEDRLGGLYELDLQRWALAAGSGLVHAANWTYWFSQFCMLSAGLLWIYLRRNAAYLQLRNTLFIVNTIGLAGYVAMPTAPPRLVPGRGFVDTLAGSEVLNHSSRIVELFANPYAAMPSLHAADALIIGVALASVVSSTLLRALFLLWPVWVWFSLLATGNHFWLDIAAGTALGALGAAAAALARGRHRGKRAAQRPRPGPRPHGRSGFVPSTRSSVSLSGADRPATSRADPEAGRLPADNP